MKTKVKKTLRRWRKKLGVGLAASAKERDITHGKVDKFGGTGMKAAALVVAVPLIAAAAPAKAQTMIDPGYSNGGIGSGNSYSYYPSGPSGGSLYTVYQNVNQEQTMSPFMRFMEQLLKAMSGDPNHGFPARPSGGNGARPPSQQN